MQNSGVRLKWITLAAAAAIYAAMVLHLAPKSSPMDPDVWLHLVKAEQLHETGFSGSSVVARLDYPRGLDSHWSRPMDVYLLAGASLFQPKKNLKHALLEFSKWVNLLPFLAASLSLIWLAANLGISQNGQIFMLMFFVFSALSLSPFGPGLADHHGPAAALFLLMTALLSQGEASRRRLWYLLAGIAAGLGMWLAPDFFVSVSLALLWLAGLWVFGERPDGGEGAAFSGGAALAALPALYAEYGARLFVHFRYDKISFPHLVLLSLVFLAFVIVPRACPLKDRKSRVLASASVVAIVLAVMALVFPGFWSGPMAEADPFISKYQLAFIHELQPTLRLEWPMALLLVFNFLFALPVLFMAVRNKKEPLSTWALVSLSTSGLFILMLLHMRWYNYAIPASMAGIALFLDRLFYALRAKLSPITLKLKCDWLAPALILLALGPLAHCGLIMLMSRYYAWDSQACSACRKELLSVLSSGKLSEELGPDPRTVAVYPSYATQVLFWTPHRVIFANYHNISESSARDFFGFWHAATPQEARPYARRRQIASVLECAPCDEAPASSFMNNLDKAGLPGWVRPVKDNPGRGKGLVWYGLAP